ncbi:hypothetical protein NIES208_18235, partial [[Limnothrix rosea] IAM M-220]
CLLFFKEISAKFLSITDVNLVHKWFNTKIITVVMHHPNSSIGLQGNGEVAHGGDPTATIMNDTHLVRPQNL